MCSNIYSQQQNQVWVTPQGLMDKVFDQYGKQYNLVDLIISNQNTNTTNKSALISCATTSYFNLYFEPGCGMEDTSNATHNERRAVLCKVFEDLSNFIVSPLTSSGQKVNIWVRNINNVYANPNGVLGMASGFYNLPNSSIYGGIADNEIWKTIHTGQDSYLNTTLPLTPLGASTNQVGLFYHGMLTFNFNDTASPAIPNTPQSIEWNTDLTATSIPTNKYDLYSAVLHEITHALGFATLLDSNGNSRLNSNYKYFTRYDTFLKTNDLSQFLITSSSCSIMYDNTFNTNLNISVLHPNPNSLGCTNTTECNDAIKFAGTTIVPVYTPNCFQPLSSLAHFEDTHFPSCNSSAPYGNDNYFLMCNGGNAGTIRRYLKPAERSALCTIGYNVNTTFGSALTYQGYFDYGVSSACSGIQVAGLNDGIETNGNYTFIGTIVGTAASIQISGNTILANDRNATGGFQCLEDLTATVANPTTLSSTFGTSISTITFTSNLAGVHLLRYVPISVGGTQNGNITYIYVYVEPVVTTCTTTPSSCNLVKNGTFEANNVNITVSTDFNFNKVCDWQRAGFYTKYFFENSSTPLRSIPCNEYGSQPDKINSNKAYAGILCYTYSGGNNVTSGLLATHLANAIISNTTYQLKFDVSQAEFYRYRNYKLQAFITNIPPSNFTGGVVNAGQLASGILLTNTEASSNNIDWDTVNLTFTTENNIPSNFQYLYIGVFDDPGVNSGMIPAVMPGCNNIFQFTPYNGSVYYIDNISLIANPGILNLPQNITCGTQLNSDLTYYITGAPTNGVFTGSNGIVFSSNNNTYSFNPQFAGNGVSTIIYKYTNSNGCEISIDSTVNVVLDNPEIIGTPSVCLGNPEIYSADIPNGTWTSSNTSIADIDANTGELTAYQAGVFDVIYTVTNGSCITTASLLVRIFDHHIQPIFNFPTIICAGATPPILPSVSNDGVPGDWIPNVVDNTHTANYLFKPTNNCNDPFTQTITVINGGTLIATPDTMLLPFSATGFVSPNFLLNDTFNGTLLTSNFLGLTTGLVSTTNNSITINQDGTLNIPPGLSIGTHTVEYKLTNNCLQSGLAKINITIYNAIIDASTKGEFEVCYNPSAYTTAQSILERVSVGGLRADASNIEITNANFPVGFSVNGDGTVNIPLGTLPGTYYLNYDLCPIGSLTGCVTTIKFQVVVNTTVRAYSDIFTFQTTGAQVPGVVYNIFHNDLYSPDCYMASPNNGLPADISANGNVILSGSINYIGNTNDYFTIFPNGSVAFYNTTAAVGTYFFTYTICDKQYQNICSTNTSWIDVVGFTNKTANINNEQIKNNFDTLIVEPNPSDNIFNIHFNSIIAEATTVEVFNLLNQKIYHDEIINTNEHELFLNKLPSGTYLLKLSDKTNSIIKKIIKK